MADMSREEMERVIDGGGSVLVRVGNVKRLATHRDHLPKESELAAASGDPATIAAAQKLLDDRIKALQQEKEALGDPGAAGPQAPAAPVGELGPTPVANPDLDGQVQRERLAAEQDADTDKPAPRKADDKPAPKPEPKGK